MGWATFIFVIKHESDAYQVTNARTRGLPDMPVQIEIETSVADRHQIDAPWRIGLCVHLNAHRHRPAPIAFQPCGLIRAYEDVRIYFVELYRGAKAELRSRHA